MMRVSVTAPGMSHCCCRTRGPAVLSCLGAPLQLSREHDVCVKQNMGGQAGGWRGDPRDGSPWIVAEAGLCLQEQPRRVPLAQPALTTGDLPAGVHGSGPGAVPGAPVSGKAMHCSSAGLARMLVGMGRCGERAQHRDGSCWVMHRSKTGDKYPPWGHTAIPGAALIHGARQHRCFWGDRAMTNVLQ